MTEETKWILYKYPQPCAFERLLARVERRKLRYTKRKSVMEGLNGLY